MVKDYFTFSKKDRVAVFILITLIIVVFFLPDFFPKAKDTLRVNNELSKQINELKDKSSTQKFSSNKEENFEPYQPSANVYYKPNESVLFYFDPNIISVDDWIKLGVKEKTANTIQKLLAKGFRFRKPEDIKKVFGISAQKAEQLIPFIQIKQNNVTETNTVFEKKNTEKTTFSKLSISIDINNSDTADWIQLKGIGSKLSYRIVNFREKLGGFISIHQVAETFGLPDSTFQKIKPQLILNTIHVRKININKTTVDELRSHPYIKWNIANAIIQHKNQHGNYSSIDDLKKIVIINDSIFQKISPYLSF